MEDLVTFLRRCLDEDAENWRGWLREDAPGPWEFLLQEVEVKRRMLELHDSVQSGVINRPGPLQCEYCAGLCHSRSGLGCEEPVDALYPCDTVRLLALPYADREGFREEWRP